MINGRVSKRPEGDHVSLCLRRWSSHRYLPCAPQFNTPLDSHFQESIFIEILWPKNPVQPGQPRHQRADDQAGDDREMYAETLRLKRQITGKLPQVSPKASVSNWNPEKTDDDNRQAKKD